MTATIESFYGKADLADTENPQLYEKEWLPKVLKYRKALEDHTPADLKIDASLLPTDLDSQFNAVKFLYDKKLLSEEEFSITDTPANELVKQIAAKQLSAVQTLKAFAKRSVIGQQFTNCAMDIFIDEGLKRAQELDDFLEKTGKTVGPLHGLPISLKEQIGYKGKVTNGGYVCFIENIPEKDSTTVKVLYELGAVFYIRTNEPQTLMHLDSMNNIIGRSRNPYNLSLSSGGSSSGEGALVAFGGSPLGVGTDIGGSIRAPAAYSGCHGLRPSTRRIGTAGGVSSGGGQESVVAVAGPMARTIGDLQLFMEAYINKGAPWNYDIWCLPIPWRNVPTPAPQQITIAVMYDDGIVKPTPPIERGLKVAVETFKKAGVNIVEFKPIKTQLAYDTVHKMYSCDSNEKQKEYLGKSGEPLAPLTKWCFNYGDGDKTYSIQDNRDLNTIRDNLRNEYNDYMVANNIDFILCPTYNNVAPKPNKVFNWSYTSLFNILDMPGLAFQTGLYQDPALDKLETPYVPRNNLEDLEYQQYDEKDFVGAPIALQLVGKRYFDEEVLAAGKILVELLGGK